MAKSDEADHTTSQGHANDNHAKPDNADHFTFTRIASTDTPFPTDPENHFSGFGIFPSVDAKGEVAFKGFDGNDQAIFVGDGDSFQFVVDLNTALPGNPGPITNLGDPVIGDGVVAFNGGSGVYEWHAGSFEVIVDHNTLLPDGGHMVGASASAIDEKGNVALTIGSTGPDRGGVFKYVNGTLTEVMGNANAPSVSISHEHVAFRNDTGTTIFSDTGGKLHEVVNPTTVAPDGGTFVSINNQGPVISENKIVFLGTTSKGEGGTFLIAGAHVTEISDLGQQPNISHSTVAVTGTPSNGQQGIFVYSGGHLQKVIAAGDELDGHTVAHVQLGLDALSGQYLAFEADFTDGSSGIYRANLHGHGPAGDSLGDVGGVSSAHLNDFYLI